MKAILCVVAFLFLAACSTTPEHHEGRTYEQQHREADKAFHEINLNEQTLPEGPQQGPFSSKPPAQAGQAQGKSIEQGGEMPVWVRDPHHGGVIGAVGIAGPQGGRGGIGAQREAAILLAQAKLAEQLKVLIHSELEIRRIIHDDGRRQAYERWLHKLSVHETQTVAQRAEVNDEWIDDRGSLYVWIVLLPHGQ